MSNAWTGGQYSVFRLILGTYLLVHFVQLLPYGPELFSEVGMLRDPALSPLYPLFPNLLFIWDSPVIVTVVIGTAAVASVALALGKQDRMAALLLWYLWACLFTRNPLIANPGLPFVGWLLLAHAALPRQPFGSWDAKGRLDPDSGWRMPNAIYLAAWIVMAVGYSYSGATKLASPSWIDGSALAHVLGNPLARPTFLRETLLSMPTALVAVASWGALAAELCFAPLALIRRVRPWLWLALLAMHVGLMTLIDFADLSAGMIMLHFFTFDPGWIAARRPESASGHTMVFYDGACGLCHRTIRILLAEDADGSRFRFAPLESESFRAACAEVGSGFDSPGALETLPDSVIVRCPGRPMQTRAEGVLEIGHELGGLWRILAVVLGWIPMSVLNFGYEFVARIRHRLFTRPDDACPLLPAHLRDRFHS